LNVIGEHNDFSEASKEVESESEEDLHGATDEKPREIRRLTQEEIVRFKKEDKCFICHKKGQIAIECQDRKDKKNERRRPPAAQGAFACPSAPTSTSTRWALVTM
jgi:hypothetical protein